MENASLMRRITQPLIDAAISLLRRVQIWDKFQELVQRVQGFVRSADTDTVLSIAQKPASEAGTSPEPKTGDNSGQKPASEDETVLNISKALEDAVPRPSTNSNVGVFNSRRTYGTSIQKLGAVYSRLLPEAEKPSEPETHKDKDRKTNKSADPNTNKGGLDNDYANQVAEYVSSSLMVALPQVHRSGHNVRDAFQPPNHVQYETTTAHPTAIVGLPGPPANSAADIADAEPSGSRADPILQNYYEWDREVYSKLSLDTSSIRLVEILRGSPEDPVSVRMDVHPLEQVSMQYEALSYVWGNPKPEKFILVNGVDAPVNPNLYDALISLRQHDSTRRIWIDAICVNQTSIAEKSKEVQKMGKIYSLAKTVNVFLGVPSSDSHSIHSLLKFLIRDDKGEAAVQYAEEGVAAVDRICEECQTNVYEVCRGFAEACLRPWFGRIWTLQEFYLAQDEPIWYWGRTRVGNASLKRDFSLLLKLLGDVSSRKDADGLLLSDLKMRIGRPVGSFNIAVDRISALVSRRYRTDGFDRPWRLYRELTAQAGNPRDYVYGLRALFDPVFGRVFVPDYDMRTELLFACLAVFLIQFECWGDVLWWYPARYAPGQGLFPSWLPDFARHVVPHELDVKPLDLPITEAPEPKLVVLNHYLYAEGYVLDTVEGYRQLDSSDGRKIFQELWFFDHALRDKHECYEYFIEVAMLEDTSLKAFLNMNSIRHTEDTRSGLSPRNSILQSSIKPTDREKLPRQVAECMPCWDLLQWHALRTFTAGLAETMKDGSDSGKPGCLENIFSPRMETIFRTGLADLFIGACIFDWSRLCVWLNRFTDAPQWSEANDRYWSQIRESVPDEAQKRTEAITNAYLGYKNDIAAQVMRSDFRSATYYTFLAYVILLDCDGPARIKSIVQSLQRAASKLHSVYSSTTNDQMEQLASTVPSIATRLSHYHTAIDLFRGRSLVWTENGFHGISSPGVEVAFMKGSVLAIVDGLSFPVIVRDFDEDTGEGWLAGCALINGVDMLSRDTERSTLPPDLERGAKRTLKFGTGTNHTKVEMSESQHTASRNFIPLHHATRFGQVDEARRLLDAGEPVNERSQDGSTALFLAVNQSLWLENCRLLLKRGANPNAQRSDGCGPLHELVSTSYRKDNWAMNFLDELYAHGADIHLQGFAGESVLGQAACQNLASCVRRLIHLGAHPDSPLNLYPSTDPSAGFRSALGIASWHAHVETIKVLIDANADVNYNDFGQTPLLEIVCSRGASLDPNRYVEGARMLIDAGADIHATSRWGSYTPLGRAVSNGNLGLAKLLIERGADPRKTNGENESLLSIARKGSHADIIKDGRAEMIRFVEGLPLPEND